ncbi:MAG: rhodanese-like domain-containing protein [Gemmatimonadaceae bacterium]
MTYKTATDLVNECKARIKQISPQDSLQLQAQDAAAIFIDVREPNEWNLGHIPGARHIPRGILESNIEAVAQRADRIVLYCASGNRSAFAADMLQQMGYSDVASMAAGFRGWVEAGGEVAG